MIIYRARKIDWGPSDASGLVHDPSGDLALAIASESLRDTASIAFIRQRGDKWLVHELPIALVPGDADLAIRDTGLAVISFIAANPGRNYGRPSNTVFVLRSVDAGRTWSGPIEVSRVEDQGLANRPRLLVDSTGMLRLIWDGSVAVPSIGKLFQAMSGDGSHWTDGRTWALQGLLFDSPAVVDRCNTIHVIAGQLLNEGLRLTDVRFPADGDPSAVRLFPDLAGHRPAVLAENDRVDLVFEGWSGSLVLDSPAASWPIETLYTVIPVGDMEATAR